MTEGKGWQSHAACGGMDANKFILNQVGDEEVSHLEVANGGYTSTVKLRSWNEHKVKQAQEVCFSCPVRSSCLSSAEASDLYWTVRGGARPTMLDGRGPTGKKCRPPLAGIDEYPEYVCPSGHTGDANRVRYPGGKVKCRACAEDRYEALKSARIAE